MPTQTKYVAIGNYLGTTLKHPYRWNDWVGGYGKTVPHCRAG